MSHFNTVYPTVPGKFLKKFNIVILRRVSHYSGSACRVDEVNHKINVRVLSFDIARTAFRIKKLMVKLAVKFKGVSVIYQRTHYMLLENAVRSRGVFQDTLLRYREFLHNFSHHLF